MKQLNEQEAQSVELGTKAQALMADQFFVFVMTEMSNAYMASLVNSKPEDTQAREGFYSAIKAMQDVGATLSHWSQVKENVMANLAMDDETPDEE